MSLSLSLLLPLCICRKATLLSSLSHSHLSDSPPTYVCSHALYPNLESPFLPLSPFGPLGKWDRHGDEEEDVGDDLGLGYLLLWKVVMKFLGQLFESNFGLCQ